MGSVTYGSTELGGTSLEMAQLVEAEIPPGDAHQFCPINWGDYLRLTRPYSPLPHWWPVRVGSFRWPVHASRWAVAYYLADDRQLDLIRQEAYSGPSGYKSLTLLVDDGTRSVSAPMYLLPPRPLAQWPWRANAPGSPAFNGLSLVTLVDERYFWWQKAANVTLTAGTTTWTQLFALVGTALGVTITLDTISAAYLKPPASMAGHYAHLPPLLDDCCRAVGHRLVRTTAGVVKTQTAATALASQNSQVEAWGRYKGGEFRFLTSIP